MTQTSSKRQSSKRSADENSISPFRVNVPAPEILEWRRVDAVRLHERDETVADESHSFRRSKNLLNIGASTTAQPPAIVEDLRNGFRSSKQFR